MTTRSWCLVGLVVLLVAMLAGCAPQSDADGVRELVHAVHDEAEGVSADQREERERRDAAVLEWAAETGHHEPITADELRAVHEKSRTGGAAENPYGVTELSFWNFYQEWLAGIEDKLRSGIRDSLTEAEVRAFYDANPGRFERQDVITVSVVPWRDGRAGHAYELVIDEANVRQLQEAEDDLVGAALALQEGESETVELSDGSHAQLTCLGRTDAGLVPLADVVQAAASQLATQRYGEELERRIAAVNP